MTTLIALMMSLMLVACAAAPLADVRSAAPPQEDEAAIRFALDTVTLEDAALTEDGTPLASYHYELPELTVLREDGTEVAEPENDLEQRALEIAETFNTRFEDWAAEEDFQELVRGAEEELTWKREKGLEWSGAYTLELTCDSYQTDSLISVCATYYSNTGGAHPNIWLLSWNFDLTAGQFFSPELLAESEPVFLKDVGEELVRQSHLMAAEGDMTVEEYFWPDYTATLAEWSSYAVSFDAEGMTVSFSPYELAAYAAGPQTFQVSYEWLEPYLGERGRMILGIPAPETEMEDPHGQEAAQP